MSKPFGSTLAITAQNPPSTPTTSTSEINVIQSSKGKSLQPGSKKKGKGKKEKDNPSQDKQNN